MAVGSSIRWFRFLLNLHETSEFHPRPGPYCFIQRYGWPLWSCADELYVKLSAFREGKNSKCVNCYASFPLFGSTKCHASSIKTPTEFRKRKKENTHTHARAYYSFRPFTITLHANADRRRSRPLGHLLPFFPQKSFHIHVEPRNTRTHTPTATTTTGCTMALKWRRTVNC